MTPNIPNKLRRAITRARAMRCEAAKLRTIDIERLQYIEMVLHEALANRQRKRGPKTSGGGCVSRACKYCGKLRPLAEFHPTGHKCVTCRRAYDAMMQAACRARKRGEVAPFRPAGHGYILPAARSYIPPRDFLPMPAPSERRPLVWAIAA